MTAFAGMTLQIGPGGSARSEAAVAAAQAVVEMLQAQQGEAQAVDAAAHFAGLLVAGHDGRAGSGERALDLDRQQALAHEAAVLRARRQLLPHVTALLPHDAMSL